MNTPTRTRLTRLVPHAVTIAAVAVLSGTTGAMATTLINGSQITPHTVTGKQVRNGSLGANVLTPSAQRSLTRVSRYVVVEKVSDWVQPDNLSTVVAHCPSGTHVLGLSAHWGYATNTTSLSVDSGNASATSIGVNSKVYPDQMRLQVICGFTG